METENTEVIENEILDSEDVVEEISDVTGEEIVEEYTPNLTYKVKDEERQFDERIASAIKSKEDEEYFRDLYTKADGLDTYKEKVTGMESQLGEYRDGFNNLYSGYEKIRTLRDNGDLRGLMGTLGVTDEQLLSYAIELAKEENLPDEQREAVRQQREASSRLGQLEKQVQEYETMLSQTRLEDEYRKLDMTLARPDVAEKANILKQKGVDLKDMVLEHGTYLTKINNGVEPTIEEAVNSTLTKYAWAFENPAQSQEQGLPVVKREPTLPKVKSAGASPAPSGPSSIEDLYKLRNQVL